MDVEQPTLGMTQLRSVQMHFHQRTDERRLTGVESPLN